ncbi:hypothetical protein EV361DRAFT_650061 [Lentinula raphanica]|nr:hypothetical protein EV361DRAFT_650061 [Lentinula raphanica]
MARERKRQRKHVDYAEGSDESDFHPVADDSDDDFVPTWEVKVEKELKAKSLPKPPSKATVTLLAMGDCDSETQDLENVDKAVLERIRKALNLSRHPGTTEHEAHQALRLAMKLMERVNVTQAQVLQSMEEKEDRLKQAGHSVVTVSCDEHKYMYIQAWASTASYAVSDIFDIKVYTQINDAINEVQYIFYGLAPNTVSAAHAFEMVYNLILQWRMANKEAKGVNAKNAYCRGVADGLYDFAQKERKRAEKEAQQAEKRKLEAQRKAEEEQRHKEIDRLKPVGIETKFDTKSTVEDEEEDKDHSSTSSPDPDESDEDEDGLYRNWYGRYDFDSESDHGDYGEEEDNNLQNGLDTEEARAEDAVAPDIRVREEVGDIDLDALQQKSNDRMRQQAEKPQAAPRKDGRGRHRVKKEKDDEVIQDVKPVRDEVVVKLEQQEVKLEQQEVKLEQQEVKIEKVDEPAWDSAGALIAFRETSLLLADDYLKKAGIKLYSRRRESELQFKDANAVRSYDKGWEDSKKIDLKRKRIKAADDDDC